jgi:hypothetical protein
MELSRTSETEAAMPALPWTSRREPEPGATYVVMGSMLPLRGDRFIPRFPIR